MLAGVGVGLFRDKAEAARMSHAERTFRVDMTEADRAAHRRRWADAVARARHTASGGRESSLRSGS
jgi:glycerol kinase